MVKYDPSKGPPDVMLAFGHIIREWAFLESTLWMYLQAMLQAPDQFRVRLIWSTLPNWQARRKLLLRLAETYVGDSALPKVRSFIKRCNKLAHHRNLVAHSLFFVDGTKVVFLRDDDNHADDDKSFNFAATERFDLTNVLNWSKDIERLTYEMMVYASDLWGAVHTSARMHREPPPHHIPQSDPHPAESTPEEPPPPPQSSAE